jgi:hypothetical protein
MRKLLVLLLCLSLFLGCKKEELNPFLKNSWGWAKAEINGVKWEANACRAYKDDCFIGLFLSNADNSQTYETLRITFQDSLSRLGKHKLSKFITFTFPDTSYVSSSTSYHKQVLGDDDLWCAVYNNLHDADSLQNWVEITEYNEKTKEIKGKFSCNLLIDPKGGNAGVKCKPTDPDTIRIRNGVFHTRITD